MRNPILSLLLAFLGYSLLNIGQAIQKVGISERERNRKKGGVIWTVGILCTGLSVAVVFLAVSMGSVSIVGAMAGSGLASLALFSRFVMKERMHRNELIGVVAVFAAAIAIGAFRTEQEPYRVDYLALILFGGGALGIYLFVLFLLRRSRRVGIVIAGTSGILGGLVTLVQKVTAYQATPGEEAGQGFFEYVLGSLWNPLTLFWIALSFGSMLVLQQAHKRDRAIRVVPSYSAHFIVIPVVGGQLAFSEDLHLIQWIGILVILGGVFLITLKPDQGREAEQRKARKDHESEEREQVAQEE